MILTGLRTNAEYHLGNYLGAILPMVKLQKQHINDYQINMFAPDLHSFTTPIDYSKLYEQTITNLSTFVAAGMPIEHNNFKMYRQSHIPAHSELTVILNNFAYFGELSRMTQFREKIGDWTDLKNRDGEWQNSKDDQTLMGLESKGKNITAGLFNYPVLMAADILLYGAKWVPVGEDQRQHLELTRDLAKRINNKFGKIFIIPENWSKQLEFSGNLAGVRIRSLSNPDNKMSKSVDDPSGTILLSDSPEEATKKIMSATTDSEGNVKIDWKKQPGISNLLQIHASLSNKSLEETAKEWENQSGYGELKSATANLVADFLQQFQNDMGHVDKEKLMVKLEKDETDMYKLASKTLIVVQQAVGLRPTI